MLCCTVVPNSTTGDGSCELACACRICVRIWSSVGSVSTPKKTLRVMLPLLALTEYMYSMPSTPLTCCSIGLATDCSTVSASAPT